MSVLKEPKWTAKECKEKIRKGVVGTLNYIDRETKKWYMVEFKSKEEKIKFAKMLRLEGQIYQSITYFKPTLFKLTNPNLPSQKYIDVMISFQLSFNQ